MNDQKMKAIVCTKYGSPDFLQLQEVDKPTPKDNEVLIKVKATIVTAADSMMRRADPFISRFFLGLLKPKKSILGTGLAGEIEAIGSDVTLFKVGDQVFGESLFGFSANAEYVSVPEDGVLTIKPDHIPFEELASVCDGPLTSMNFLKSMAKIQPGHKVLINGASGAMGTAAVQLAKHFGADVTGVCSGKNVAMVTALGARKVIDYMQEDFTETEEKYDIIFDTVGKNSFSKCKKALTETGIYLSPVLDLTLLFQMIWTSIVSGKKAMFSATGIQPVPQLLKLLNELKELIGAGKLISIIDRRYPLEQVADAHRYVDTGHKKGNVVINVSHG
jgi:NADPH:quinone reductase-like Zn-dependent oxidoreductase